MFRFVVFMFSMPANRMLPQAMLRWGFYGNAADSIKLRILNVHGHTSTDIHFGNNQSANHGETIPELCRLAFQVEW
jgi:hypothetical protein